MRAGPPVRRRTEIEEEGSRSRERGSSDHQPATRCDLVSDVDRAVDEAHRLRTRHRRETGRQAARRLNRHADLAAPIDVAVVALGARTPSGRSDVRRSEASLADSTLDVELEQCVLAVTRSVFVVSDPRARSAATAVREVPAGTAARVEPSGMPTDGPFPPTPTTSRTTRTHPEAPSTMNCL